MSTAKSHADVEESVNAGFGTVDDKGRVSLPKPVRQALGVAAGSSVAYVMLDHALLLIPQDAHLATLLEHATQALAAAGLSAHDLVAELPAARADIMAETYSADFLRELEQLHAALHAGSAGA